MLRTMACTLSAALLVGACSDTGTAPSSTTVPTTTTTTTTTVPSDEICRIGDLRFGDEGLVAALGEDVGDAETISQIRWEGSATCERISVEFASDSGAPASTLGPTGVSVVAFAAIVRVTLPPEVAGTAVADLLSEGALARRIYVVRADDGSLSIDIHAPAGQSVAARAFVTTSPSTLVIDVIDGEAATAPAGTLRSRVMTVVEPSPGSAAFPVPVRGYAAPGLGTIRLRVTTDGDIWTDRTLSLSAWPDAWQSFATSLDDGPSGMATIFLGTVGPEGEPDEGVEIAIDLP